MNKRPSQIGHILDQIIAAGLVVTLIFAALAHGAVEPWSVAVCSWLIIALIALWAIKMIIDRRFAFQAPATALPLIALLAFGLAQSVALTGPAGERRGLSLDVEATRRVTLLLGLWLAAFVIAANFFTDRKRLKTLAWFLTCYGLAMAVFALVQHFAWNGLFYWVRPMGELTSPFGSFINHNLFAGHMELLAFIPAGMALAGGVRGPARLFFVFASVMMSLSIVLSLSRGGTISLGAGMIFLAMMSGVVRKREESFMSLQRCPERMKTPLGTHRFQRASAERTHFDEGSSSVSQHAGSDAYPGFSDPGFSDPGFSDPGFSDPGLSDEDYQPPEPRRSDALRFTLRSAAVIAAMAGVIALGLLWLGPEPVINRATQGQLTSADPRAQTFFTSRGWIWQDTWTMIRANPVLGVGLGAYETAYPIYTVTDGAQKVSEAHNDYLQILADGGIIGALLALWFLWLIFRAIFSGVRARDRLLGSLALGGGAAIVAMLVHSFFDFNLQIPSNALMFLHSAVASNIGAVSQVSMETAVTGVELEKPMMKANAASLT